MPFRSKEFLNAHFKVNWPQGQERTAWAAWGTITKLRCPIYSQNALLFRNLASIVPTTHGLKFLFSP